MDDYYARLQVAPDASKALIRKSYRRLAKSCHPDLHAGDERLAQLFIRITEAYDTLSDDEARRTYDLKVAQTSRPFFEAPPERGAAFGKIRPGRKPPPARTHARMHAFSVTEISEDLSAMLLSVTRSPITYCIIIVFVMLLAFKEAIESVHHPLTQETAPPASAPGRLPADKMS